MRRERGQERELLRSRRQPRGGQLEAYKETLVGLRNYIDSLGLDELPSEVVRIVPGTDGVGRPTGALLPKYPQEECKTNEWGIRKVLFNLKALAGFDELVDEVRTYFINIEDKTDSHFSYLLAF